ncbi:transmembrane protein 18 [Bactrocera neohumeralis]|uniref:transmembrane protein 18 n=1 Tax=Bactrocera tryoni TaxID=59916 RepID=UPI001A9608F1|nr:transmembrane protein 18 [Bactrocera tryoni]XP_050324259.1 transmembrane protein 18 [Bactrocera neohumeralis]
MVDPNFIEVNEITGYWSFLASIDWNDPWLIALIAVHVLTTVTTLMTRNNTNFQIFLFLILLSAAYCSESINEFAAAKWKSFSKQQYFDSNGLFISTVFSIPILLNCMLIIGAWMYNSLQIMVTLKRAQLLQQVKRNQQEKNSEPTKEVKSEHVKSD